MTAGRKVCLNYDNQGKEADPTLLTYRHIGPKDNGVCGKFGVSMKAAG